MRYLLSTAAVFALTAGSAAAGPLLEEVAAALSLPPEAIASNAGSERIEGDVEIYENLEIADPDLVLSADLLSLAPSGDRVTIRSEGLSLREASDGTVIAMEDIEIVVAIDALSLLREALVSGGERYVSGNGLTEAACARMADGIDFDMTGLSVSGRVDAGGRLASARGALGISDPEGACLSDWDVEMRDLRAVGVSGDWIRADAASLQTVRPLADAIPSEPTGHVYSDDIAIEDLQASMSGVGVRADRLVVATETPADSLTDLADVDYTGIMGAVSGRSASDPSQPLAPDAAVSAWNAIVETSAMSRTEVGGLRVMATEQTASMMLSVLAQGGDIDATISTVKDRELVEVDMEVDAEDLLSARVGLGLEMGRLSEEQVMPITPMAVMALPISLTGLDISFVDQGLETALSPYASDPYGEIETAASRFLGPDAAGMLSAWMSDARSGGADFSADPARPVPLSDLAAMFFAGNLQAAREELGVEG